MAQKPAFRNHMAVNVHVFRHRFCLELLHDKRQRSTSHKQTLSQQKRLLLTLKNPPPEWQQCQRQSRFAENLISHWGAGKNGGPPLYVVGIYI